MRQSRARGVAPPHLETQRFLIGPIPQRPTGVLCGGMEFRFGQTAIRLTHPDAAALLAAVGARLSARQGFALATLNLDHLVKLGRDAAFRGAYAAQDFVVADGNPVVWMAALGGQRVALVPGSDLVVPLARMAAAKGASVALLGTTETALSAAAGRLQAEAPGLIIARKIAPPMGFDPDGAEARAILAQLEADRVGLCFLALGAPKQERLAALGRQIAPSVGFASIGAGLDFLAGTQTRAPAWARAIAMEWAWRMLSAPRRLVPRYAACAAILPGQAWQAWRQRR